MPAYAGIHVFKYRDGRDKVVGTRIRGHDEENEQTA